MPHEQQAVRKIPLAEPVLRQRVTLGGHALSAVLHVGVVAALVWGAQVSSEMLRAPGEGPGRGGGGGGGSRVFRVLLPFAPVPAPPAPPTEEAIVIPTQTRPLDSIIPPPDSTAIKAALAAQAAAAAQGQGEGAGPGTGPGQGGGTGGGTGGGVGSGVGPDSGGGGGRMFPPQLQGILLPPDGRPGNLRGVELTVHFEISERGQVLSVQTEPEIRDRGYRNAFLERMRRYTFTAATLDGRPVRAPYSVRIRL